MRGEGGVAGEGRFVGVPNFHSWGKCTMPLANINTDWMSNASSGLCIILVILVILVMSKVTAPQDAHKQISAGFSWLKHFRIQWYVGKNFGSRL